MCLRNLNLIICCFFPLISQVTSLAQVSSSVRRVWWRTPAQWALRWSSGSSRASSQPLGLCAMQSWASPYPSQVETTPTSRTSSEAWLGECTALSLLGVFRHLRGIQMQRMKPTRQRFIKRLLKLSSWTCFLSSKPPFWIARLWSCSFTFTYILEGFSHPSCRQFKRTKTFSTMSQQTAPKEPSLMVMTQFSRKKGPPRQLKYIWHGFREVYHHA